MPDKNAIELLLIKIRSLPPPWCDFALDKANTYLINGQVDYDSHGVVRELIYLIHGEEPSISMGKLPPIISPMFWETISGFSVEEVKSLKYPDTHVTIERYERYKQMARYWQNIYKIYPIDLKAYRGSLIESYNKNDFSSQRRIADIDRRIRGLHLFRNSLAQDNWQKLLIIVPDSPEVWNMHSSFTITPHMEVQLFRGEGRDQHHGRLYYSPETNKFLKTAWNKQWNVSLSYAKTRDDWPNELVSIDFCELFQEQCQQFNIGSIDRIIDVLDRLNRTISGYGDSQPESRSADAFLCHASEDKGAIVRRFHNMCKAKGITTWFDENEVCWGDRILEKISHGLAKSRFVVVFVSNSALEKEWVREELKTALTLSVSKEKFVLPVLLGITVDELSEHHPVLASRHCLQVPLYDPKIAIENDELERIVRQFKSLSENAEQSHTLGQ
jgi:hypothetical protein